MDGTAWAREMALYNKWQNEALYAVCADQPINEITRDRGMFFASILGTLDHILMVDRMILAYAHAGHPPKTFDATARVSDDFAELRALRSQFDDALLAEIETWTDAWVGEMLEFHSERHGGHRRLPRSLPLSQMFNHATHHRSQVTAELHRMGCDYGCTDIPFNPLSQYR